MIARGLTALLLTAASLLIGAPPATASHAQLCTVDPYACAGTATFEPYGEHLIVCDETADGYRAVAFYYTSESVGTVDEWDNAGGAGTCADLNLAVAESGWIDFTVCLQNGEDGEPFTCSRFARHAAA